MIVNTLTKIALGLIGQLKPESAIGDTGPVIELPAPDKQGGIPLMQAFNQRQSSREFIPDRLPLQVMSDLLWAAFGINRPEFGGHTAPSAMHANEIDVYAALPEGLYRYDPDRHTLRLVSAMDVRRVTGYQDFVDDAPLDLIFVADHSRMKLIPVAQHEALSAANVGAIAENVYLYCASAGLSVVVRAWFDRKALSEAMKLDADQHIVLTQTLGYGKR
jgi:SagB-type dehydrogenase family enzyme